MSYLALGLLVVVVLIVTAVVVVRLGEAKKAGVAEQDMRQALLEEMSSVVAPIVAGQTPNITDVERFAAKAKYRQTLFDFLLFHRRLDLFPARYRTQESLAEAQLVSWLSHPNELGAPPDEVEFAAEVNLDPAGDGSARWFVYRFRVNPPHWAAKDGWMAGVVGPIAAMPAEVLPDAPVVWSMFQGFDSATVANHALACRDLARKTGIPV